jgi:copper chaperone CopZ
LRADPDADVPHRIQDTLQGRFSMHVMLRGLQAASIVAAVTLAGCEYCFIERSPEAERLLQDKTALTKSPVSIQVMGMSCPKCVTNVDIQLMRVNGVKKAQIDMGTGVVTVDIDPAAGVTRAALAKAVDDSGLTVTEIRGL